MSPDLTQISGVSAPTFQAAEYKHGKKSLIRIFDEKIRKMYQNWVFNSVFLKSKIFLQNNTSSSKQDFFLQMKALQRQSIQVELSKTYRKNCNKS